MTGANWLALIQIHWARWFSSPQHQPFSIITQAPFTSSLKLSQLPKRSQRYSDVYIHSGCTGILTAYRLGRAGVCIESRYQDRYIKDRKSAMIVLFRQVQAPCNLDYLQKPT